MLQHFICPPLPETLCVGMGKGIKLCPTTQPPAQCTLEVFQQTPTLPLYDKVNCTLTVTNISNGICIQIFLTREIKSMVIEVVFGEGWGGGGGELARGRLQTI